MSCLFLRDDQSSVACSVTAGASPHRDLKTQEFSILVLYSSCGLSGVRWARGKRIDTNRCLITWTTHTTFAHGATFQNQNVARLNARHHGKRRRVLSFCSTVMVPTHRSKHRDVKNRSGRHSSSTFCLHRYPFLGHLI